MKITKPEKSDLEAVWNLIHVLNTVSYEQNPLKPIDDDCDFEWLKDEDKPAVLNAAIEVYENCDLEWLMMALETLLYPENKIIDDTADILNLHPDILRGIADSKRLSWLEKQMLEDNPETIVSDGYNGFCTIDNFRSGQPPTFENIRQAIDHEMEKQGINL